MTPDSAELLELVGHLHEGVADDGLWDRAFEGVSAMLGIDMLLMGSVSRDGREVRFQFGHRSVRNAIDLLEGPLADPAHNPWIAVAQRHPLRRPVTVDDVGGEAALKRTRVWTDLYAPFGIGDSMGAALERQPDGAEVMMIGRRSKHAAFGRAGRDAYAALIPHLARAWRVKRTLAEWQARAETLESVLDRLERGIVITDGEGKLRFANRAADRLLSRGDAIDATRGRIRAGRSRDSAALLALDGRDARTANGRDAVATDALALERGDEDGAPLAVVAEPLAPAHSDTLGHRAEPGAVLFISDSDACTRPSEERIRLVYGLTPAEARLTALVVEGKDSAAASRMLGVSGNTVKTHLKSVFDKVGVSRQAELVRRVLADVGGLAEPEKLQP
jgi:DNA-binding CsgD family transcriptional regulator/PAS domain-containing protein